MSGPVDTSTEAVERLAGALWAATLPQHLGPFEEPDPVDIGLCEEAAVIIRALAAERDAALTNLDRYAADAGRWRGIAEAQEREIAALRARIASLTQPLPEPDPGASQGPPEAAGGSVGARASARIWEALERRFGEESER